MPIMVAVQVQGHGASPTIEAPDRLLHEETFERTMDRLEKAHHAALQAMSSTQNLQPGHPLPSAETVLDMDAAFTASGLLCTCAGGCEYGPFVCDMHHK